MSLQSDLVFAVRIFVKRPIATSVMVATLGLGIAANGIFFASVYGSAFRPLPFEAPDRLVSVHQTQPAVGSEIGNVSAADFRDLTDGSSVFVGSGAYTWHDYAVRTDQGSDRIQGAPVTASLFPLLGINPMLGRGFTAAEDSPGGPLVALISHQIWRDRYHSDRQIVGKTIQLDGHVHSIVGVMPEGFRFSHYGLIWTPLQLDPELESRTVRNLGVVARLADGVTVEQADLATVATAERLAAKFPDSNSGWSSDVRLLRDAWMPSTPVARMALVAQLVLFAGVLLVVCVNVTNIILAQASTRRHERAVRATLGASRSRLISQTLIESGLLALAGGTLGALIALGSDRWLGAAITVPLPYWLDLGLEINGLVYVLLLTILATVAIGILPAVRESGPRLVEALANSRHTEARGAAKLRKCLIVAQYGVAVVVLVAGMLVLRSFHQARHADRGFATENLLTVQVPLSSQTYQQRTARTSYVERALQRLGELPHTTSVAAANALPTTMYTAAGVIEISVPGFEWADDQSPRAVLQSVGSTYFDTLAIPMRQGRRFHAREVADGADTVIISASLAEFLWPGEDPLHRDFSLSGKESPTVQVVGVVGDVEPTEVFAGFGSIPRHRIYLPLAGTSSTSSFQGPPTTMTLIIASPAEPAELIPLVRQRLASVDPSVPPFDLMTMNAALDQVYFAHHMWNRVFAAIALLALVMTTIGVYGITAYSVSRMRREMGIRLALGAASRQLLALVLRQGVGLAALGVGLGLLGAIPLANAMKVMLHEVPVLDPISFGSVIITLLALGLGASYLPARHAAATDPIEVLRDD